METQIGLIVAVVGVGIALVGVVISMMFWARGEANRLADIQKEDRKDLLTLVQAIKEDVKAIQDEIKSFHTRLCLIEERKKY